MSAPNTSTTTWQEEVRRAESIDAMETAGNLFPLDKRPIAYEWSNGRQFREGHGPYTES
jgi:hypothetical protein